MAMIEDPEALDCLPEILATPGLDAIAMAAAKAGKPVCAHVGGVLPDEINWLCGLGVSAFIVSSDQGLMRRAGAQILDQFKGLK